MRYAPEMHVWFIDDRQDNRDTWMASFPASVRDACELRTFASVPDLFAELDGGGGRTSSSWITSSMVTTGWR